MRAIILALRDTLPLWLLIEWLCWRVDPQREVIISELRAHGQTIWAKFIYEDMNYGRGELSHWYQEPEQARKNGA